MADMTYRESGDENESPLVERTAVPVASIAVNTSRRDLGLVMVRRRLVFVGVRNEREYAGLFGSISAFLFGLVERLIRRLDQVGGRGIPAGNRTGKACADRGDTTVGVRDAEGFDSLPKCFRHLCRSVCTGAGKHDDEFVSTIPGNQVSWPVDRA